MAFHQPAAHQIGGHNFCRAAEEGFRQSWEILSDGVDGDGRSSAPLTLSQHPRACVDKPRQTQEEAIPQPAIVPTPIQDILIPISLGELIDKITILQIKTQRLQGNSLKNAKAELITLEDTLNKLQLNIDPKLIQELKDVNQRLWQIEDDIRTQERQKSFGASFIHLARSVYQQNDRRSAIKKKINIAHNSAFIEEKSYQPY